MSQLPIFSRMGSNRRFVACEANPNVLSDLALNARSRHSGPKVAIEHGAIALDNAQSTVTITANKNHLVSRAHHGDRPGEGIGVPAITLNALLNKYGISDFALVSDIEGAEAGFILGDSSALSRCRQMIVELHYVRHGGSLYSPDDLAGILQRDFGFKLTEKKGTTFLFERDTYKWIGESKCSLRTKTTIPQQA